MTEAQFKEIFDQYFDPIRRYLYFRSGDAALSTDLAQDTFMKIWEKGSRLNPDKIKGLLYKIAGDLFVSHHRRFLTGTAALREISFTALSPDPHEQFMKEELEAKYRKSLGSMPEKQRSVFLMSRMEDLGNREIAERLSLSVKAVEKRMTAALAHLKKDIKS